MWQQDLGRTGLCLLSQSFQGPQKRVVPMGHAADQQPHTALPRPASALQDIRSSGPQGQGVQVSRRLSENWPLFSENERKAKLRGGGHGEAVGLWVLP